MMPRAALDVRLSIVYSRCAAGSGGEHGAKKKGERERPEGGGAVAKPRPRRAKPAVTFRRGVYKNLEKLPPWTTTWTMNGEMLGLTRARRGNATITLEALVEPCGASGFFVDAVFARGSAVDAACDGCGETFTHALPPYDEEDTDDDEDSMIGFLAFLDPDAPEPSVSGDYEVFPFPRGTEELDLTALARDTCESFGFPPECLCPRCRMEMDENNVTTWRVE